MQKRDNTIGTRRSARKGRHHPKTVLVLRHRPKEREFRKVLPWRAAELAKAILAGGASDAPVLVGAASTGCAPTPVRRRPPKTKPRHRKLAL